MDTEMHRDAFGADHDPSVLQKPSEVANRIVARIVDEKKEAA
jgi:hypothetical protein